MTRCAVERCHLFACLMGMPKYSFEKMMVASALSWLLWWASYVVLLVMFSAEVSVADILRLVGGLAAAVFSGSAQNIYGLVMLVFVFIFMYFVAFLAQRLWYHLVSLLDFSSRFVGEVLYVLSFGFAAVVCFTLPAQAVNWGGVLLAWGLLSLLPLYTLLSLRGLERYGKSGFRIRKPL